MARFSVLSHETKALFWKPPRHGRVWLILNTFVSFYGRPRCDGRIPRPPSGPSQPSACSWFAGRRSYRPRQLYYSGQETRTTRGGIFAAPVASR